MKRRVLFLSIFFLFILYYVPILHSELQKNPTKVIKHSIVEANKKNEDIIHPLPVTGFENYINGPIENYVERHGQPSRIGPSNSGGEWWIFTINQQDYVQIEVKDRLIQSIFVLGEKVNTGPIRIGMTRENIYDETRFAESFTIRADGTDYQLSLTKDDLEVFPLIRFENNSFAMLFFQPERNDIYGLRFLSADALLQTNYYHTSYEEENGISFNYPVKQTIIDSATSIEKEEQLFSFFSIVRKEEGLDPLVQSSHMNQLAEDIVQTTGDNRFTFGESTQETYKSIEELPTYDKVKEIEYITGRGIVDTPTQFGMFMKDSNHRTVLMDSTWEELSIKTVEDDFLLLFN